MEATSSGFSAMVCGRIVAGQSKCTLVHHPFDMFTTLCTVSRDLKATAAWHPRCTYKRQFVGTVPPPSRKVLRVYADARSVNAGASFHR